MRRLSPVGSLVSRGKLLDRRKPIANPSERRCIMLRKNSTRSTRLSIQGARLRAVVAIVAGMLVTPLCLAPCVTLANEWDGESAVASAADFATAHEEDASLHDGKATGTLGQQDKHKTEEKAGPQRHSDSPVNAIDGIILALVVGAVTAAIKSLAKEGARRCSGNCSACLGGCPAGKDLSQDEKLQAKLRALHQGE